MGSLLHKSGWTKKSIEKHQLDTFYEILTIILLLSTCQPTLANVFLNKAENSTLISEGGVP